MAQNRFLNWQKRWWSPVVQLLNPIKFSEVGTRYTFISTSILASTLWTLDFESSEIVTTISGADLVLADFSSLFDLCSDLISKSDWCFSDTLLTLELIPEDFDIVLICEVPGSSLILDSNFLVTLLLSAFPIKYTYIIF